MTNDLVLARLRAANPAPHAAAEENEILFKAIVASAGDARLRRPPRVHARRRWQFAAVAACALVVAVATAWAASADVRQLFTSNPAGGGTPGNPPTGLWHQVAIPSTIRLAGAISIPGAGKLELWVAVTKQHGWCGAIRLPDGGWAGTKEATGAGGTAPGCYPSRAAANAASDPPVYVISGFDYYDIAVDARGDGGRYWHVLYGVTELDKPVARVVDTVSGRDAAILSERFFALAVADDEPEAALPTRLWHLVAYDAAGDVVADADKPLR